MAEELLVILNRKDPSCGLGFSLLGTPGLPPIIYDIVENSPAAESGKVEAGDVILKVNDTDVNRFNTKEVLKCLRLSENPVALKLKRDPVVKAKVRNYLSSQQQQQEQDETVDCDTLASSNGGACPCAPPQPAPLRHPPSLEDVTRSNGDDHYNKTQPRCEAFLMTGDRVLKLSRTAQSSLLPKQKKVDSLHHHHPPHHQHHHHHHHNAHNHHHNNHHHQKHNSVPTSPIESERHHHHHHHGKTTSSAGTSPTPSVAATTAAAGAAASSASSYVVRTSRSEDQLQFSKDTSIIQDENCEILNARDLVMEVSDPSDSDSTLLLSENTSKVRSGNAARTAQQQQQHNGHGAAQPNGSPANNNHVQPKDQHNMLPADYRIVIQVKGPEKDSLGSQNRLLQSLRLSSREEQQQQQTNNALDQSGYQTLKDMDEEGLQQLTEGAAILARAVSPPTSHATDPDESDVESLHSFHYSPKAVDLPSAERLAKRLFTLDGFKKSDVSRHLSKNNDFSRAVAEEYLKYFVFQGDTLDLALRKFLKQFSLSGETQERERVLLHFSKRYLDCNPGSFNSQDAVHTLTCAIMLLNTDLNGQGIGHKMSCSEFIENLSELNDGDNFPRDVLKCLYQAIKSYPLEWAIDDEPEDGEVGGTGKGGGGGGVGGDLSGGGGGGGGGLISTGKGFFDVPSSAPAIEYKKGYVMRKSCIEPNGKKTPLGKRGWKMFYCTLRDLVLYLHKDEHGFRKTQLSDNLHNAIRIHHSLATKAADYTKKLHVFRLETADQAEYLFQTSDSKELQSWIDTINFVCASFSAPPLPGAVGSQKKFQRPLLPSSYTKLNLREQLRDHEDRVQRLESELEIHRKHPLERGAKALVIQNYKEKDAYLHYELKRYKTYAYLLRSRISQYPELEGSLVDLSIGEALGEGAEEEAGLLVGVASSDPASGAGASPITNRYSYRAAIYSRDTQDLG
ncbi:hypothetical protein LSTR_LSTR013403 [Laodelphax striatellus]|uniref:Uncharacterized protein n=1 Tax=Laodelphax striatellus TaxID=195883 RepID=A0A482WPY6_LAOST|nr:hypothetical protein LSTR_LSTR013403 [Laodelphax striatellus]